MDRAKMIEMMEKVKMSFYKDHKHEVTLTVNGIDEIFTPMVYERLRNAAERIKYDLGQIHKNSDYSITVDEDGTAFDDLFRQLYGGTWAVIQCGGIREKQAQRDVIDAVLALVKERGVRGEYEIKISRSVMKPEREDVSVKYNTEE